MDIVDAYNVINQQAQQNNQWSAQMAANNMNFQLDMANTAHQREVADLKAAGLNPILSAHGNGAPVGSGAMASPDANNTAFLASVMKDLIQSNTAIGVANAKAAGGGYYGSTGENDKDIGNGNPNEIKPGNYAGNKNGVWNAFQDFIYGLTGATPREWIYRAGVNAKNTPKLNEALKNGNTGNPAVTTAKGNVEYGARPWYAGIFEKKESGNKPMTSDPEHKYGYWVDSQGRQYDSYRHGTHWVSY